MADNAPLIVAMAETCREMILAWSPPGLDRPASLQPAHLNWMCREIAQHASDWPATKVHRWLGFIQGAMIANRIIDLPKAKEMFDRAKHAHGAPSEDLLDHLDPGSSFRFEIGGQG
jgi:hypothetical protein